MNKYTQYDIDGRKVTTEESMALAQARSNFDCLLRTPEREDHLEAYVEFTQEARKHPDYDNCFVGHAMNDRGIDPDFHTFRMFDLPGDFAILGWVNNRYRKFASKSNNHQKSRLNLPDDYHIPNLTGLSEMEYATSG